MHAACQLLTYQMAALQQSAQLRALSTNVIRSRRIVNCRATANPEKSQLQIASAVDRKETRLHASTLPLLTLAGAEVVREALQGQADYFASLNLPEPLVHWGHPGNMMVVLLAMGGYGAGYLGWQIRTSPDPAVLQKARDMHPKLSAGMFLFFALGAVGGTMSLIMQGRPIFDSAHATTGLAGLALLTLQSLLPAAFSSQPAARTAHALLGSAILALFAVHAVLGIQLGLAL